MCSYFSLFKPLMLRSMFFQHRGLMWVDLTCEKKIDEKKELMNKLC